MPKVGDPGKGKKKEPQKPDVRLALTSIGREASIKGLSSSQESTEKPDVRLAFWANQGQRPAFDKPAEGPTVRAEEAPNVRLAHGPGAQGDNVLMGRHGIEPMGADSLPALLVSYFYLDQFQKNRHRYHYRDWVMDSGAFSAHNSGAEIKLQDYIDCCKRLMEEDPTLVEIYALDVIGDWKASLKNTEEMWRQGVPAIPCFHADEPWSALIGMAKDYPKIALGGVALAKSGKKMAWAKQCFARVWPKKIHGFAFCSETAILGLPFHSTDATSWEIGPCRYGQWRSFGGQRVSVRGSKQNLRVEVEWYLELERKARARWKKEMAKLEELCPYEPIGPAVRLAFAGTGSETYLKNGGAVERGLAPPDVRLVAANDAGQGGARVLARGLGEAADDPGQQHIRGPKAPSIRLAEGGGGGRTEVKANALSDYSNKDRE